MKPTYKHIYEATLTVVFNSTGTLTAAQAKEKMASYLVGISRDKQLVSQIKVKKVKSF